MNKLRFYAFWLTLIFLSPLTLAGCEGNPTPQPAAPEADEPTEVVEPDAESAQARTLVILSFEGTVHVRTASDTDPVAAIPEQILSIGDELVTGADGHAVLEMDDGTVIVITEDSSFTIQTLGGSPDNPISRFFLMLGEVFAFREGELPDTASFEIETPNGIAGIRGSMLSISYNPETGRVTATCLTGHCSLAAGEQTAELTEGQYVEIEGFDLPPGEVVVMNDAQLQAWIDAAETATEGGVTIHLPDVTSLLPETPSEAAEELAEPECSCVGPDYACDNGTISESHEECLTGCSCDGFDFICEDGTVIEGHDECGGCLCDGFDLYCDDTLTEVDSVECGWVCELANACGNNRCDSECENSDLCPDDCFCADDGICSPGEGFGCRDCVGPDEGFSSVCGVPCQESCEGDLACVDGFCWDPCTCSGSCGEGNCPVSCTCICGTDFCTDCNGNTWTRPGCGPVC